MDGDEAGNWMPEMVPVPPEDAGTVVLDLAGPVEAGSFQRFTLTYTAGRYGIDDTGSIKICFRFASDMGKPQFTDPAAANFVTVAASNSAKLDVRFDLKGNTRPSDRSIHIKVMRGFMRFGDTIAVGFGTDPRGPGQQMQTFVDPDFAFRVLADPIATYTFVAVPGVPKLPVEPGAAHAWHLVLPTQRGMGDAVALCIRADDAWGNPTWKHGGQRMALTVDGPLEGVPAVASMPAGEIALRLEGLRATAPGIVRVSAPAVNASSNPMVVQESPSLRAYWGDLHAQSGETIGSGTIEAYLRYARDYAFLDAIGHQGNDFQITPQFWGHLNRRMAEWNAPGRFVTVPGYEWSGNTALGGDRNVFYQTEDRPIRRSSHALVPDRDDLPLDCWDARALFEALRPEAATTVMWAHCGGRYADIRYAHDPELECSVEVHSSWGTFEWLVADAFELGLRVGIVANSDGHKGRPGAEPPGASLFGALGGLTCYLLPELSRSALFDAMRARHHYATTGCRLHLETEVLVDGRRATMGDIVPTGTASVRFRMALAAASPVLSVELRRGCEVIETIRPHADAPLGKRVRMEWSGAEYPWPRPRVGVGRFCSRGGWDGGLGAGDQLPEPAEAVAAAGTGPGRMDLDHDGQFRWRGPGAVGRCHGDRRADAARLDRAYAGRAECRTADRGLRRVGAAASPVPPAVRFDCAVSGVRSGCSAGGRRQPAAGLRDAGGRAPGLVQPDLCRARRIDGIPKSLVVQRRCYWYLAYL